jgi:hypothetical protein
MSEIVGAGHAIMRPPGGGKTRTRTPVRRPGPHGREAPKPGRCGRWPHVYNFGHERIAGRHCGGRGAPIASNRPSEDV